MYQSNFLRRFRGLVSTLCLLSLLALCQLALSGCGDCKYDSDCENATLCREGVCTAKDPERRTPPRPTPPVGECIEGEQRTCFSGPTAARNQGICKEGSQLCVGGSWEPCKGEQVPASKDDCDGLDNNCDGKVDEDCDCKDGDTQKCYTGTPETRNKGGCLEGEQVCANGQWGTCLKQKLPQAETCNGVDDDCDGKVDDDVTKKCQSKCGPGVETCTQGKFGACSAPAPVLEKCGDEKDNDCDGAIDEGCDCKPNSVRPCYAGDPKTVGEGPCVKGVQSCSADGKWLECNGQVTPKVEQCDNRDNDCNGKLDDDLKRPCARGCNAGQEFCQAGAWKGCDAKPAEPEVCDGKDNDCDGKVDNQPSGQACECRIGQQEICYDGATGTVGVGLCKQGQRNCQSSGKWSLCVQQVVPAAEDCDGLDNDCDGAVDNMAGQSQQLSRPCYDGDATTKGIGACKAGLQRCQSKRWTACTGQQLPQSETCDGKDNDCDGAVDEATTRACYAGASGTAGVGLCKQGKETCRAGKWGACVGEITPVSEACNQKDDDCDGQTDESGVCDVCKAGESQACYTGPIQTRNVSPCRPGTQQCVNGQWAACVGERKPQPETCNGIDDDCDGTTNDNVTRSCSSICGAGKETCSSSGQWGTCDAPTPKTEICNGLDDDCDGTIDNGLQCALLAASDLSGKIVLWDPLTLKQIRTISTGTAVNQIAFSPDKTTLAAATANGAKIYNVNTGLLLKTLATGAAISVTFSPNGQELAVGTASSLGLWRVSNSTERLKLTTSEPANCAVYHPTKGWLALCQKSSLFFITAATGKTTHTTKPGFDLTSLAITKSGTYLLLGGRKKKLFSTAGYAEGWQVSTLPAVKNTSYPVSGEVYDVGYSSDDQSVLAAGRNAFYTWERSSGRQTSKFSYAGNWNFYSGAFDTTTGVLAFGVHNRDSGVNNLYFYDFSGATPLYKTGSSMGNDIKSVRFRP